MNRILPWACALALLACFPLAGCSRDASPPAPLPADQIASALQKEFTSAAASTRSLSTDLASAVQSSNYVAAFSAAQSLCARPDLNKKQQVLAARVLLTVNELLRAAEARGDKDAAAAIQMHRSTR